VTGIPPIHSEPVDISAATGPDALKVVKVPGRWEKGPRPGDFTCALGGDPGGTTGLFLAAWKRGARKAVMTRSWQCDMDSAPELLGWILEAHGHLITAAGFEAFDARLRGRSLRGFSPARMHKLTGDLIAVTTAAGITAVTRAPSLVKPWATDKRLSAAGLWEVTNGMPDHARDAARHCLYAACKDAGMRDPLSRAGEGTSAPGGNDDAPSSRSG
jgi:hypothetical protein